MAVRETVEPLLQDLAAGRANPADQAVQRDCAIAAARLRRLFAESDDAPDPLIHELLACADVAERRGVAADLEAVGGIPAVPAATSPGSHRPGHHHPVGHRDPGPDHGDGSR